MLVVGFGAVSIVMFNPDYQNAAGGLTGGRNMVVLHAAHYLGGDILLGLSLRLPLPPSSPLCRD